MMAKRQMKILGVIFWQEHKMFVVVDGNQKLIGNEKMHRLYAKILNSYLAANFTVWLNLVVAILVSNTCIDWFFLLPQWQLRSQPRSWHGMAHSEQVFLFFASFLPEGGEQKMKQQKIEERKKESWTTRKFQRVDTFCQKDPLIWTPTVWSTKHWIWSNFNHLFIYDEDDGYKRKVNYKKSHTK